MPVIIGPRSSLSFPLLISLSGMARTTPGNRPDRVKPEDVKPLHLPPCKNTWRSKSGKMDEEKQTHDADETTPERIRRVLGKPLPVEPRNRWLWMIGGSLIGIILVIIGLGVAIAMGASKFFEAWTERIIDMSK